MSLQVTDQIDVLRDALEAIADGHWGTLLAAYGGTGRVLTVPADSEIRALARLALERAVEVEHVG